MNKTLCSLVFLVLFTACSPYPTLRQQVVERFNTDKVVDNPSRSGDFLVKDNKGSIWYVDACNDTNLTKVTLIFSAPISAEE